MNRRTFLKIAGMGSVSIAAAGCSPESPKYLYSLVQAPDDMVTGTATWYASTCRECPAGCGILAKNREGRVVKLEGNPLHPVNRGKLCMRGQAALQAVYSPDRLRTPLLREKASWRPIAFSKARAILKGRAERAAGGGPGRIAMLTEVVGRSLLDLFQATLQGWRSQGPLIYEPYAHEALKAANREIFQVDGLVSYRMQAADVLVSFGADFLETWLSPVEYARKFKAMHALQEGNKGRFFHVSPYQSLSGANADHWLPCNPGTEAVVAFGLIKQALDIGKGGHLPPDFRNALYRVAQNYPQERVVAQSAVPLPLYDALITRLIDSRRPLVLGTPSGASDMHAFQTHLAANTLNLLLDPELRLIDRENRHRLELAAKTSEILELLASVRGGDIEFLLLNNVNPAFSMPAATGWAEALETRKAFTVSFSNFMDETSELADLIIPVRMPLETWDDYGGWQTIEGTLQPAMGRLTEAPHLGDVFLRAAYGDKPPVENYKAYIAARLAAEHQIDSETAWVQTLSAGGRLQARNAAAGASPMPAQLPTAMGEAVSPPAAETALIVSPSIRYYDGRGTNRPWLSEVPDPICRVSWHTPVLVHPETAVKLAISQEDMLRIESESGAIEATVYTSATVKPGVLVMNVGQGHTAYGRYAAGRGANPWKLLPGRIAAATGGMAAASPVSVTPAGRRKTLARMYGSRTQHGRPFALSIDLAKLRPPPVTAKEGLTMNDFPLTLPLPEGYDPGRDFYPAHDHDTYRWGMAVDLDRCIGCGACSVACYAENNIGIVGERRIIEGREMIWLGVERYEDERHPERLTFLPMMCQHCDNAPCESVCPVYAPHHSKEGLNNQIYNRCIGTRYCSQNCPYKVRRFNWFSWEWPEPANLQLNPDVTVRSKGVMEKCSFCIQRIKVARTRAKNENRTVHDGEIIPACAQTCPTEALVFGNLMDKTSRVRRMVDDPRAYQVLGYLNTKPAVIYLKKVTQYV
jgi:molybdopterin-containing oxidoreductase family iron-sulfur binding subunit